MCAGSSCSLLKHAVTSDGWKVSSYRVRVEVVTSNPACMSGLTHIYTPQFFSTEKHQAVVFTLVLGLGDQWNGRTLRTQASHQEVIWHTHTHTQSLQGSRSPAADRTQHEHSARRNAGHAGDKHNQTCDFLFMSPLFLMSATHPNSLLRSWIIHTRPSRSSSSIFNG